MLVGRQVTTIICLFVCAITQVNMTLTPAILLTCFGFFTHFQVHMEPY